jgi:YidC/Oxa1 family membrane protein insertase
MDKRSLIAIGFCIAFYLGYTQYLQIKYPDYGKPRPTEQAPQASQEAQPGVAPAAAPGTAAPASETVGVAKLAPEQLVLETDQAIFRFSQENGGLESVRLKGYKQEAGRDEPALVTSSPVAVHGVIGPDAPVPAVAPVFSAERTDRSIRFWREQSGIRITQEYRVPARGYGLELEVAFANVGQAPVDLVAGVIASETIEFKESTNILGFLPGVPVEIQNVVTAVDDDSEHHELRSFCEKGEPIKMPSAAVQYAGLDKHYFMALFLPKSKSMSLRVESSQQSKKSCRISIATFEPQGNLQPGQAVTLSYGGFFGPKDLNILSAFDEKLASAIDFGVFGFIARPLLYVIQGFNDKLFRNYGLAIIFLTILLKVLFYPLMRASAESMHKMKQLQPQMKAMQEKFKDDRQRLNQELMKFYAQHKINPMKGCLPILPQIPVFFAFYQVLQNAIELRHAPFYGWIQDLSSMDPYLVTPLLMGVAMFVQQKLTPTAGMDKTQEKILMFMPIMFTVMMLTLPAGLTLYMLTNTVTGIAQTQWLNKRMEQKSASGSAASKVAAHKVTKAKA